MEQHAHLSNPRSFRCAGRRSDSRPCCAGISPTPFDAFVDTIGSWWPLRPYSVGGERVHDVVVERQTGGLVYEVWADGTTIPWGRLLVWDRRSGS